LQNFRASKRDFGELKLKIEFFLIISILEKTTKQVITPFFEKNLDFWK